MSIEEKKETFFTVIIPTRDRSDTLIHTLKTALSQDYDQFQVLVADNASDDDTYDKVTSINDPRLKYINTTQRVSMSENWEFALSHVDRGWVTIIGDDDALLPGALSMVHEIIEKTGTSAIRSNGCSYRWPGFDNSSYGWLSISLKKGYEIRESGQILQQVLDGARYYHELPMLYNGGFISVDLIKQAKSLTERFFMSMTPDVYSAIVFSLLTDSFVYSHEPLAINGASLHSGGTAGFERVKQKRSYDPAEKFWSEKNIPFHEELPVLENGRPVRSIQVLVYEAYLQAKKFHSYKKILTNHATQLKLACRQSGPDHAEIVEWARLFAQKHSLDLPRRATYPSTLSGLDGIFNGLKKLPHTCSIRGDFLNPLSNVADASLVAGSLRKNHPSIFKMMMNSIRNWITQA